jgi:hypothetical protein
MRATILLQTSPQSNTKLWDSKVVGVLIFEISKLPLRSPKTKWRLGDVLWPSTNYTIRGKVVASPSLGHGESCESVFARGLFMHQKFSNYTLTNLLFGLCKSVWVIELFVNLLSSHPRAPTCPFTPKVLRARERTLILSPSIVFTFGLAVNPSKSLGMHQLSITNWIFKLNILCIFCCSGRFLQCLYENHIRLSHHFI